MKKENREKIIYLSKFLIPLVLVILLFLGGISTGIVTFEKTEQITGKSNVTIIIDFGDGTTYSKTMILENSTVFDFLLRLEDEGEIATETTYWNSFDGYSIDSISYNGKKYEGDTTHYWSLLINDEYAMQGANKIYVRNNDIIKWEFVTF